VTVIISTTRFEQVGSILANQIDSVEACLAGTGTSEINDSLFRVNPAAPECLHQFAKWVVCFAVRDSTSFADRSRLKCVNSWQDEVASCRRIAALERQTWRQYVLRLDLRRFWPYKSGCYGQYKETASNDRQLHGIVYSIARWCGQFRFHLGSVG
jgi:hypothetical protein